MRSFDAVDVRQRCEHLPGAARRGAPVRSGRRRHAHPLCGRDRLAPHRPRCGEPVSPGEQSARESLSTFRTNMRAVEAVSDSTVRVQPGVVRDHLNRVLRPYGRYFPPDPSNSAITTVGGMLGVDAAGSHSVRVGSTRDHVESIETVLADGTVVEFGEEPLVDKGSPAASTEAGETDHPANGNGQPPNSKRTIVNRLAALLAENKQIIRQKQPPLIRNSAGYYVRGLLSRDAFGACQACWSVPRGPWVSSRRRRYRHSPFRRTEPQRCFCSAISSRRRAPCRRLPTLSQALAT